MQLHRGHVRIHLRRLLRCPGLNWSPALFLTLAIGSSAWYLAKFIPPVGTGCWASSISITWEFVRPTRSGLRLQSHFLCSRGPAIGILASRLGDSDAHLGLKISALKHRLPEFLPRTIGTHSHIALLLKLPSVLSPSQPSQGGRLSISWVLRMVAGFSKSGL